MSPFPHIHQELADLDRLIGRLPFDLDDGAEVGRLFERTQRRSGRRDADTLALWTYCYVRRYFLLKFAAGRTRRSAADLDMLVERSFRRIERNRSAIRDGSRYSRWVVVICRNTFVNYLQRHPQVVGIDRVAEPGVREDDRLEGSLDAAGKVAALNEALRRLPDHMRDVARMRLVDGLSYPVIAERTGHPVPIVRAYLHKAVKRLRADDMLLRFLGYEFPQSGSRTKE